MNQSPPIYRVSDLVNEMRRLMESSYPEVWIEGELSSLSTPASGHLYFSLKDEQSQLRCAMFRNRANLNSYKAKTGDLVRVRAKISVYPARGDLQCIVQYIEEAGEGALQRQYEELRAKLNQEGLFNADHKLPIPSFPDRIGLITSPSGAAVKDILTTLARRCPGIPITLYPAVVQGENAAKSLVQALMNSIEHDQVDVIIIGRGGGSLEDLWCFNDEILARAIYQSPIPIVSAVGHEVDTSISDYVADLRAPTPTAAAEMLSPDSKAISKQITSLWQRANRSISRYLNQQSQNVDVVFSQLHHPKTIVQLKVERLSKYQGRLQRLIDVAMVAKHSKLNNQIMRLQARQPKLQIQRQSELSRQLSVRLLRAESALLSKNRSKFESLGSQLHLVSPLATLERGFSITRNANEEIIRDAASTIVGDSVKVDLKSGSLQCQVQEVIE